MAQISIFNDNGMKFLGFQPHKADTGVSWEQHFFNYVQSINAVQLTPYQTTLLGKFRVSFEDLSILPRPASSYQLTIEVLHPGPVFGAQPQEKYVVEPSAPSFSGFVVFPIFLCSSDAMSPPIVVTNFRYTLIRKRSILSNVTESSGIFKLEGIIQRHTPLSAGRLALAPLSSGTQPTVTYNYTPLVGPNAPGGSMAPAGSMLQQQPVQSPAAYPRLDAYGQPPASVPAPVQAPAVPMAAAVGGLAGTAATPAKCNQPGCTNYGNAKNEGMCNTCAEQLAKAAGVPAGQQLYQQPQQQQQQQYQPQQYQQQQYQQPLGMGSQYQQPQQPQQPVYQQAPSAPQAAAPLPEDDVAVQQQAHQTIVQSTPRCISSGCDNFGNTQKGGQCNSCHAKLSQSPQSLPQAQLQLQQPMYQFIGPQGGQVQAPQGLLPSYQSAQQPLPMTQALQQPVQQYQQPQLLQQPVQAQYQQAPQQFQQQLQPQQPQQLQQLQQPQQPQYQQFVQVQAPASLQEQQQAAQPAQQAQPPQPSVLEQQFQPVQQQLEQQFQQQQPQDQPSVQQQQPVQQQQQPALLQPVQQQQPMQQQPMQALEQPEPAQQQQLYQQVAQPSYQQPQQPQQQQEAQASPSAYAQYASLLSFDQNGNQSSQPGFAPGSGSVFQGMVSPQGN